MANWRYTIAILAFVACTAACSAHRETVTTERVRTSDDDVRVVERTTSSTHTDDDDDDDGIVGGTVGFVGDVVAFPFRVVGGVVDTIF